MNGRGSVWLLQLQYQATSFSVFISPASRHVCRVCPALASSSKIENLHTFCAHLKAFLFNPSTNESAHGVREKDGGHECGGVGNVLTPDCCVICPFVEKMGRRGKNWKGAEQSRRSMRKCVGGVSATCRRMRRQLDVMSSSSSCHRARSRRRSHRRFTSVAKKQGVAIALSISFYSFSILALSCDFGRFMVLTHHSSAPCGYSIIDP